MTTVQLPEAVRGGARAALAAQLAAQLLALGVLAALLRLVDQADFGLLGMALPVVLLLRTCVSLGLAAAAVQRGRLSDGQLNSLFWFHQAAGVAAALATAAAGPLLARWYGAPPLIGVCLALSGASLAATFGGQHLALLERKLQMGRIAVARLAAQAAGGGAAVAAAFAGWGVWALVVQQYVELLALGALAWGLEPWRPTWPNRGEPIHDLVRFGGYFSLSNLLHVVAFNADNVLLSVMLGGTSEGRAIIGMYSQAFNLMIKPVYIVTTPLGSIALPALSRAAAEASADSRGASCQLADSASLPDDRSWQLRPRDERASYAGQVGSFFRLVGIVLFPCGVGLFLTARDVMLLLGGEKWQPAGVLLEALAPAILAHGLITLCTFVFTSAGRTGRLFVASLLKTALFALGYVAGYYLGWLYLPPPLGPTLGVAYSHSLVALGVLAVPYVLFCLSSVRVSPRAVFSLLARPLLSAVLMGLAVWSLREVLVAFSAVPAAVRLAALIGVGVGVYALMAWQELSWLAEQLRTRRGER